MLQGAIPSSMDMYIVQAPKNTAQGAITSNSVIPQPSNFVLYVWLNGN